MKCSVLITVNFLLALNQASKQWKSNEDNLTMSILKWQSDKDNLKMVQIWPFSDHDKKKNGDTVECVVVSIQVQPRRGWVFGRVWKLFCIHNLCALSVKRYFVLSSRSGSDAVQRLLIVCQGKIGPGPPLVSITVFASMAFSHTSVPLFSCTITPPCHTDTLENNYGYKPSWQVF